MLNDNSNVFVIVVQLYGRVVVRIGVANVLSLSSSSSRF